MPFNYAQLSKFKELNPHIFSDLDVSKYNQAIVPILQFADAENRLAEQFSDHLGKPKNQQTCRAFAEFGRTHLDRLRDQQLLSEDEHKAIDDYIRDITPISKYQPSSIPRNKRSLWNEGEDYTAYKTAIYFAAAAAGAKGSHLNSIFLGIKERAAVSRLGPLISHDVYCPSCRKDVSFTGFAGHYSDFVCPSCGHLRSATGTHPAKSCACHTCQSLLQIEIAPEAAKIIEEVRHRELLLKDAITHSSNLLITSVKDDEKQMRASYLVNKNQMSKDERLFIELYSTLDNIEDALRQTVEHSLHRTTRTKTEANIARFERTLFQKGVLLDRESIEFDQESMIRTRSFDGCMLLQDGYWERIDIETMMIHLQSPSQIIFMPSRLKFNHIYPVVLSDTDSVIYLDLVKITQPQVEPRLLKKNSVIVNPFFVEKPLPVFIESRANNRTESIFKSPNEVAAYHRLKQQYGDVPILANVPFRSLVSYSTMAILLEKFGDYLSSCMLDFVVCDEGGVPFLIEEVQAGKHHNDPDWVEKDRLKREASRWLGLNYQESY